MIPNMEDENYIDPDLGMSRAEVEAMEQQYLDALNSRELLAKHEAGHAVVAEHFKMGVKSVVVYGLNQSFTETDKRAWSVDMLHNELVYFSPGTRRF
jgi:hypothetical protein